MEGIVLKLSEIKGEKALDLLVDLLDPATEVFGDKEFADLIRKNDRKGAVKVAIGKHKKSVLTMLALLRGENPDTYEPNILEIPRLLLELLNDPELISLFPSQVQNMEKTSFGLATENTEA
jgi:hypothetical protein